MADSKVPVTILTGFLGPESEASFAEPPPVEEYGHGGGHRERTTSLPPPARGRPTYQFAGRWASTRPWPSTSTICIVKSVA